MSSPLLSVIIPVYNVENYLEQCVESVLTQDFKDLEIILVDDGSTDGSAAICDKYSDEHDFINVVHKTNGGASSARNTGIDAAHGKYICFMDSDDWWNKDISLNDLINEIINNKKENIFTFSVMGYNQKTGKLYINSINDKLYDLLKQTENIAQYYKVLTHHNFLRQAAYSYFIKTDFIKKNKLYFQENIICEDIEWMFRVLRHAKKIIFTKGKHFYIYRKNRMGSITNTATQKNVNDLLAIIDQSCCFYNENSDKMPILKYEMAYLSYIWLMAAKIAMNLPSEQKKEAKQQLKQRKHVFKYAMNKTNKIAGIVYNLIGFDMLSLLSKIYISWRNRKRCAVD